MFRNRPEYRFEGRIHEQIAQCLPSGMPERIEQPTVRIEHYGYLGAVRDAKEKSRRNIELLERQQADGEMSPFLCFNLGSEYAAAGDAKAALAQFEHAWEMLKGDPERTAFGFVPSLTNRLVKRAAHQQALRGRGGDLARRASDLPGLHRPPAGAGALRPRAGQPRRGGAEIVKRCLEMGDAPSRYSPTVGCGSYLALGVLADIRRDQGDFEECERLLEECLREHPVFLNAVHPFAAVMLARGKEPELVVETLESVVATLTPSVHFMLGSALYEQRHVEAAEAQFRAVLDKQPRATVPRVALSRRCSRSRRWQEAAEAAAEVDEPSGYAAAARRSELFGLIMAGETRRGGRAGALRVGRPAARRGSSSSGVVRRPRGRPSCRPRAHRVRGAPRADDARGAAARAGGRGVRRAAAAGGPLGLPTRDRREQLGAMYLRRGFLESAGDEWVAAIQEQGPDPPR